MDGLDRKVWLTQAWFFVGVISVTIKMFVLVNVILLFKSSIVLLIALMGSVTDNLVYIVSSISTCYFPAKRRFKHKKASEYFPVGQFPKVDILIPCCNEPDQIVFQTIQAAKKILYPNFEVYVLDDGKSNFLKQYAAALDVHYIRRVKTAGVPHHAKAGNLNNYFKNHCQSDFILVIDSDHIPRPYILDYMVPHFFNEDKQINSKTGIVQAHMKYRNARKWFGYYDYSIIFHKVLLPAYYQNFNDSVSAGTAVMYSVEALRSTDGFCVGKISEDFPTSIELRSKGYTNNVHVPIVCSDGMIPDNMNAWITQQYRWAYTMIGSLKHTIPLLGFDLRYIVTRLCFCVLIATFCFVISTFSSAYFYIQCIAYPSSVYKSWESLIDEDTDVVFLLLPYFISLVLDILRNRLISTQVTFIPYDYTVQNMISFMALIAQFRGKYNTFVVTGGAKKICLHTLWVPIIGLIIFMSTVATCNIIMNFQEYGHFKSFQIVAFFQVVNELPMIICLFFLFVTTNKNTGEKELPFVPTSDVTLENTPSTSIIEI